MRNWMLLTVCLIAITTVLCSGRTRRAEARTGYAKTFVTKYVENESTPAQKALAKEVLRVKRCDVCHDPRPDESGKVNKKNRNPYGQSLAKQLGAQDEKDQDKVAKMLEKIETEKTESSGVTFGELIKAGKLPFEYKAED